LHLQSEPQCGVSRHHAGSQSGLTIEETDLLKIRVTYDNPIKVPLMQFAFMSVMCGDDTGI